MPGGFIADRFLGACQRAADRAGLLVGGDVGTALQVVGSTSHEGRRGTGHLIECALSPRYLQVRARLGVGAVK